jgi:hypothetical protein
MPAFSDRNSKDHHPPFLSKDRHFPLPGSIVPCHGKCSTGFGIIAEMFETAAVGQKQVEAIERSCPGIPLFILKNRSYDVFADTCGIADAVPVVRIPFRFDIVKIKSSLPRSNPEVTITVPRHIVNIQNRKAVRVVFFRNMMLDRACFYIEEIKPSL